MASQQENPASPAPLIMAHQDSSYAATACAAFRQRGWDVHLAGSGRDVRQLTRNLPGVTLVLSTDYCDESGWLLCDKLVREQPGLRVVLVAGAVTPEGHRLASFVGAAGLVGQPEGLPPLLAAVCGEPSPVAP